MITKPILAGTLKNLNLLKFPVIVSPKLDGIRCLKINGEVVSRTLKLIPNRFIQKTLNEILPDNIDGEIIVGSSFQECTSGVMSFEGEPLFIYWAFDYISNSLSEEYQNRIKVLKDIVDNINSKFVRFVETKQIYSLNELYEYEEEVLGLKYEGVMIRSPASPYKCGRSTEKEGYLLKLKRFLDSEAVVIGFEEMFHNENKLEVDNLGYAKRSSSKEGKIASNTLGKFIVRDIKSGITFFIGTGVGLTAELRAHIWNNQEKYLGRLVKYKYQSIGVKVAPRLPIWLGFRSEEDL